MRKGLKVLIVEDEVQIARFVELELQHEGFVTEIERNGRRAYSRILQEKYDVVLLDWMLPGMDGLEICRLVRQVSDVPIIMVTARGDIKDRVQGLNVGADDYITKPFVMDELIARIKVCLRKHRNNGELDYDEEVEVLSCGDVSMDVKAHQVRLKGQEVELTKKEFQLLYMLLVSKNKVVSRDKIIEAIWENYYNAEGNGIDVYVRYLRQKLEVPNGNKKLIYTIRGIGYVVRD